MNEKNKNIESLDELAQFADYSFVDTLNADLNATEDGLDHEPREVFSGHYVPVCPTPIDTPHYIAHSEEFFKELGLSDSLAQDEEFMRLFSGDTSELPSTLKKNGWATGYALSIYGTEYYQQCPFGTGNGYGDGRAISILEAVLQGKRYEMQLKGGGKTPYCRGADGRAVLRSSIREFLAQEHMHALGIPSSRSLTLYTSKTEHVARPWFRDGSYSKDPEVMIREDVAITTRVAPSFLRVGQLELFGRRARKNEHPHAMQELEQIVRHAIEREYKEDVNADLPLSKQLLEFAVAFRSRLTSLVANWIRVGYCQGNFNSDNCSVGGYTLDYGPFGFIDMFDPKYQPWTGGGEHFSFFNQPQAAHRNFEMFCKALAPLLTSFPEELESLKKIENEFESHMQVKMIEMWSLKLGLDAFDAPLVNSLITLMIESSLDYTLFFRELSNVPDEISTLQKSFYKESYDEALLQRWSDWLKKWRLLTKTKETQKLSEEMKRVNPKYTLREWLLVPAYEAAYSGDYEPTRELQKIMNAPYDDQSLEVEKHYYAKKATELFNIAGISHVSCSS